MWGRTEPSLFTCRRDTIGVVELPGFGADASVSHGAPRWQPHRVPWRHRPVRLPVAIAVLALVAGACSGSSASLPSGRTGWPATSASAEPRPSSGGQRPPPFVAFRAVRPARLRVVDTASGQVRWSVRVPSSVGYAASLRDHAAYLPVARESCVLTLVRTALREGRGAGVATRRVANIDGGLVDNVDAMPALSADGSRLTLVVTSKQPGGPVGGMSEECGDTDSLVIIRLPGAGTGRQRPEVHYVMADSGAQLDDLAWDHRRVLVRVTQVQDPRASVVRAVGPRTRVLSAAPVVLREPNGRYGPVFRYDGCLSVIFNRAVRCVRHGHLAPPRRSAPTLPRRVAHVSVSDESGNLLLVQTRSGTTYWWDGRLAHVVPVTARGRWGEPTW